MRAACGYADGYPRHAPSGTPVAVMGRLTQTVGRVSMDMLACDLSDIPEVGIGALGCVAFGVGTTDMANAFMTGAVLRLDGGYVLGGEKAPRMPKGVV